MINGNVSDSAAATQQHLVLHRALVHIQWIGGGPVGEHTHAQPGELEKVVGIRGFGGQFAVIFINSLTTHDGSRRGKFTQILCFLY